MHVSMMGIFHTKSSGSLFTSSTFFTKFQNKKGSRKPATRLLVCVVMQTDLFLKLKKEPPRNGWTARQQTAHNTHTEHHGIVGHHPSHYARFVAVVVVAVVVGVARQGGSRSKRLGAKD